MRFFIDLAYDGATFHGWQKQPNACTVQETLETLLAKVFRTEVPVVGAGRTDTGVHAKQLIAHFDWHQEIDAAHLIYKLNRMLPAAIAIKSIYRVKDDAHARFDALSREYKYYISLSKNPFTAAFSCLEQRSIKVDLMTKACAYLLNHRDFQCFSKVKTDVKTYNCTIEYAFWEQDADQLIFTIKADRFLRNMVRAIVGTLVEIGLQKRPVEDMQRILNSKDRCQAGKSIAAKGLFLTEIVYPQSITQF